MSVIVKGIKMPENCFECPCCRHDSRNGYQKEQCNLTLDVFDAGYYERFEGRAQNCPLIALPDHHGRLVDADMVDEQPTIEPRNKGHWIKISPANIYECSECGKNVMTDDISAYDFCHGCGAEMTEGEE